MQKEVTKLQAYRREIKTESESRISTCQICGKEIMFGRIFCEEHDIPINKQIYEFFSEFPKNKDGLLIRPRGEKLYQVVKYYLAARLELSKDKRIIMKSCTGAGKSVMLDMLAFIEMTHFPNSLTIIGSISEAVSKMHIERLREWIGGSVFNRYMVGTQEATASKTEIKLAKLNSKVMAMPQSPKSRTGWHASLLLVDEIGRMEVQSYYACASNDTEILTEDGWLSFEKLCGEKLYVRVATLNEKNGIVEYHYPLQYFSFDYDGQLFLQQSKFVDFLVTPNHECFISPVNNKRIWKRVVASELPKRYHINSSFNWKGKEQKYFTLPAIHDDRGFDIPEKKLSMDNWLAFLGIFLAEGSTSVYKKQYRVLIAQKEGRVRNEIRELIQCLGFHWSNGGKFQDSIHNKQLFNYLHKFGTSHFKYIPKEIKKLDKRQLNILLNWLSKGDGHYYNESLITYTTASKQLADDVQEIALKGGWIASISVPNNRDLIYRVNIKKNNRFPELNSHGNTKRWVDYKGKVYDIEVPNHLIYVRRNGKSLWTSNSFSQMAAQGGTEVLASTPYLDSIVMQNIWADDNIIKIALEPEECFWIPKEVFRKKEEEYRIGGISALYEQLYGAQFRSLTNRVIPDDLLLQSMARGEHYPTSKNLIMGIDFGKSIDFTAIVVIDIETGDIKFVDTFQDDWPIQFAKIRKYAKEWNPIKIVADSSHIGDVILSDLRELNIEGVSMHNDILKKSVIDRLIMAFFNNKLNIVSEEFPKLINEVSSYVYYDSDHKKMGPSGRGHDDTVIALSLALRGLDVTSVSDTHLPDNLWSFTRVGGKSSNPWAISNV